MFHKNILHLSDWCLFDRRKSLADSAVCDSADCCAQPARCHAVLSPHTRFGTGRGQSWQLSSSRRWEVQQPPERGEPAALRKPTQRRVRLSAWQPRYVSLFFSKSWLNHSSRNGLSQFHRYWKELYFHTVI